MIRLEQPLDLVAVPGHHPAAIAVFDQRTGLLLSGDTLYPGRIYVTDVPAFEQSVRRLGDFARARSVSLILGCHVEMSRDPGRDYPPGCRYQPDEAPLQMSVDQLELLAAATATRGRGVHKFDQFVLYLGMGPTTYGRLALRGLSWSLRDRLIRR